MANKDQVQLRRLRWRCRRGLLELDLLLGRFLTNNYGNLDDQGQRCFRDLLEQSDALLLSWLQGQQPTPEKFKQIVTSITQ